MPRLTYTVHPVPGGWHLREGDEDLQWFREASEALQSACNVALYVYEARGIPTAVLIDTGRHAALVSRHG